MSLRGTGVATGATGAAMGFAALLLGLFTPHALVNEAFHPEMDCTPPRNLLCDDAAEQVMSLVSVGLLTAASALLAAGSFFVWKAHRERNPNERRPGSAPPPTPLAPPEEAGHARPRTRTNGLRPPLRRRIAAAWARWRRRRREARAARAARRSVPPPDPVPSGPRGEVHPGHGRFHPRRDEGRRFLRRRRD